jgi:hypothetical protein
MESLLVETETLTKTHLIPAFGALYEAMQNREAQRAVTDRILGEILSRHKNDISAAVDAVIKHSDSGATAAEQPSDTDAVDAELRADPQARLGKPNDRAAVGQVKQALDKWYSLANRKIPLVKDADSWVDSKIRSIVGDIENLPDDSKYGRFKKQLIKSVRWFGDYQRDNPKKSAVVVATLGVIAGLLGSGAGWAFAAVMIVIRLALMVLNGVKFSTALTKVLTTSGLSILLGMGLSAFFNNLFSSQQAASSAAQATEPSVANVPSNINTAPLVTDPYIEALRRIVDPTGEGTGIPTMTQEKFGQAWRAAREAMGPGNVFVWDGKPFTTNTREEGLLYGLSDAAKRFIRGVR